MNVCHFEVNTMRTLLTTGVIVASLFAAVRPAHADQIPALDIQVTCRGIASHAAGPGERGGPDLSLRQCIKSELRIRGKLARQWAMYSADEKAQCLGNTQGDYPSYTDLLTCLEMVSQARNLRFRPPLSIER
jgi:hypothetical protein